MKRFSFAYLILSGLASSSLSVMAGPGIAYPDPPGGWTYILDGSQAAPGTASAAFDALDGTWNAVNGSSEWSRDGVGGTLSNTNPPGGVSTFTEGDLTHSGSNVTYLRIQDTGNPSQYSGASFPNNGCGGCTFANPPGSNRKLWFGHDEARRMLFWMMGSRLPSALEFRRQPGPRMPWIVCIQMERARMACNRIPPPGTVT